MKRTFTEKKASFELKQLEVDLNSNNQLKNISGGVDDFWRDFGFGSLAGGVVYDVAKTAVFETSEAIGNNVYEGWSPAAGGFLF